MMTVFEKLTAATIAASNHQELPDFLADRLAWIVQNQEKFKGREAEIARLVEMVSSYDTYGQTGYLGMGVNNAILEKALAKMVGPAICPGES